MNLFILYLFLKIDSIRIFSFIIFGVIGGLSFSIIMVEASFEDSVKFIERSFVKISFIVILVSMFMMLITLLVPTSKQIAIMYVLPKTIDAVKENKTLQKIPTDIEKIYNLGMDKLINKLEEK